MLSPRRALVLLACSLIALGLGACNGLVSPSQIAKATVMLRTPTGRSSFLLPVVVPLEGAVSIRLGEDPEVPTLPIAWRIDVDPPGAGTVAPAHGEAEVPARAADARLFEGTFDVVFTPLRPGTINLNLAVDALATRRTGGTLATFEATALTLTFDPPAPGPVPTPDPGPSPRPSPSTPSVPGGAPAW